MAEPFYSSNRVGKFTLGRRLLKEDDETVRKIMQNCIIVRAEHLFTTDAIEYVAYSDLFEKQLEERGTFILPTYKFIIENGEIIRAERID